MRWKRGDGSGGCRHLDLGVTGEMEATNVRPVLDAAQSAVELIHDERIACRRGCQVVPGAQRPNIARARLLRFACTTLVFGLSTVTNGAVHHSNIVVGMAISTGGIAQMPAGMWEFPNGNTLGATALTLFGSFWLSYAAILSPVSGILASYPTVGELRTAIGFFYTAWFTASTLVLPGIAALGRKPAPIIVLFGFLSGAFAFLGMGEFTAVKGVTQVGGALGIVTGLIAYFVAFAVAPLN
ncbi:GPR1/FUN34/yaaH family-domain-containing protein [Mycena epipterygia]|nr:GPR1/FUN34/yaaH family-domain-containing protein [Mycena epipterygia]